MSFIRTSGNDVIPGLDPAQTNGLELILEYLQGVLTPSYSSQVRVVSAPTPPFQVGPISVSGIFTLPPDEDGIYPNPTYVVGSGTLKVYRFFPPTHSEWRCTKDVDYVENGTPGQQSNSITWLIPTPAVTPTVTDRTIWIRTEIHDRIGSLTLFEAFPNGFPWGGTTSW